MNPSFATLNIIIESTGKVVPRPIHKDREGRLYIVVPRTKKGPTVAYLSGSIREGVFLSNYVLDTLRGSPIQKKFWKMIGEMQ